MNQRDKGSGQDKIYFSEPRPPYPEIAANAALVLINVACSLLERQIAALAEAFENEDGFTERLYRTRKARQ